jgi:hypothetical protein
MRFGENMTGNSDIFPPLPLIVWEKELGADTSLQAPVVHTAQRNDSTAVPHTSKNNSMQVVGFCGYIMQCLSAMAM